MKVETALLNQIRKTLLGDYLPKIEKCLEMMTDEDLWWRAHESDNSAGNLLLHLAGSVRYWIVSGAGGAPDRRDRQQEFDQRAPVSKAELLAHLRAALQEAGTVLASLDAGSILTPRPMRGGERTPLYAVLHAMKHFAYHTGQIVYITKLRTGADTGFSRHLDPRRNL